MVVTLWERSKSHHDQKSLNLSIFGQYKSLISQKCIASTSGMARYHSLNVKLLTQLYQMRFNYMECVNIIHVCIT